MSLPDFSGIEPIDTPARVSDEVLRLAAAIVRRHPSIVAQSDDVTLEVGVRQVISAWAATIPNELELSVRGGTRYNGGASIGLSIDPCDDRLTFGPAFERANRIRSGLGWQLLSLLLKIEHRHGFICTPMSTFDAATQHLWYGAASQKEWEEEIRAHFEDDDEALQNQLEKGDGPQRYLDAFPEVPTLAFKGSHAFPKAYHLKTAASYRRATKCATDVWEQRLLQLLGTGAEFLSMNMPSVWDLVYKMDSEFEHGQASHFIQWTEGDDLPYWHDEVMNSRWEDGFASDATFEVAVDGRGTDQTDFDLIVATVEACAAHHQLMTLMVDVLKTAKKD